MNRKVMALGGAGLLLGAAGLFFYIQAEATKSAEAQLRQTLLEWNLDRAVRYREANASLLSGSLTLKSVEIHLPDLFGAPVSMESLVLSDIDKEQEAVTSAHIEANGVSVPVLEEMRNSAAGYRTENGLARDLVALGYLTLKGESAIDFNADPSTDTIDLAGSVSFQDLGSASGSVSFSGVAPNDLSAASSTVAELSAARGWKKLDAVFSNGQRLVRSAERIELRGLSLEIEDDGYRERAFRSGSQAEALTSDDGSFAKVAGQKAALISNYRLEGLGLSEQRAREYANKIGDFVENGGRLRFSTDIRTPVRLLEKGGFFGLTLAKPVENLDRFVYATYARLER